MDNPDREWRKEQACQGEHDEAAILLLRRAESYLHALEGHLNARLTLLADIRKHLHATTGCVIE